MSRTTKIVAVFAAMIVLAGAVVAIYFGSFALAKDSANRGTEVTRSTNQYRTAQETTIRQKADAIASIDVDMAKNATDVVLVKSLTGQRVAFVRDLCAAVKTITQDGLAPDIAQVNTLYCAK